VFCSDASDLWRHTQGHLCVVIRALLGFEDRRYRICLFFVARHFFLARPVGFFLAASLRQRPRLLSCVLTILLPYYVTVMLASMQLPPLTILFYQFALFVVRGPADYVYFSMLSPRAVLLFPTYNVTRRPKFLSRKGL